MIIQVIVDGSKFGKTSTITVELAVEFYAFKQLKYYAIRHNYYTVREGHQVLYFKDEDTYKKWSVKEYKFLRFWGRPIPCDDASARYLRRREKKINREKKHKALMGEDWYTVV